MDRFEDASADDSVAYRTASEDSSKYFSLIEDGDAERPSAFDDNESSADGHELVIDDDRQPSDAEPEPEPVEEVKADSYNFPEGSHCVTIQIDGTQVDAINIGQDVYIYTDADGDLRAFQLLKEDGNVGIKYLHVGKKDDGSIEVYEEQVNQVPVLDDQEIKKAEDDSAKNAPRENDESKLSKLDKINSPHKNDIGDPTPVAGEKTKSEPTVKSPLKSQNRLSYKENNVEIDSSASQMREESANAADARMKDSPFSNLTASQETAEASSRNRDVNVENVIGGKNNILDGDALRSEKATAGTTKPAVELLGKNLSEINRSSYISVSKETVESMDKIVSRSALIGSENLKITKSYNSSFKGVFSPKESKAPFVESTPLPKVKDDKNDSQSSIDSDDEFGCVIEGEPVTGDCEVDWSEVKTAKENNSPEKKKSLDSILKINAHNAENGPTIHSEAVSKLELPANKLADNMTEEKMSKNSQNVSKADTSGEMTMTGNFEGSSPKSPFKMSPSSSPFRMSTLSSPFKSTQSTTPFKTSQPTSPFKNLPLTAQYNITSSYTSPIKTSPSVANLKTPTPTIPFKETQSVTPFKTSPKNSPTKATSPLASPFKTSLKSPLKTSPPKSTLTSSLKTTAEYFKVDERKKSNHSNFTNKSNAEQGYDSDDSFNTIINPKVYALKTYSKETKPRTPNFNSKTTFSLQKEDVNKIDSTNVSDNQKNIVDNNSNNNKDDSVSKYKSVLQDALELSHSMETSPKNRNRQPRKQVFTPVSSSEIEIIFPNIEKDDKDAGKNVSKTKPYGRNKSKMSDSDSSSTKLDSPKLITSKKETSKTDELNEPNDKSLVSKIEPSPEKTTKIGTLDNQQSEISDTIEKNASKINSSSSPKEDKKTLEDAMESPNSISNSSKKRRGRSKKETTELEENESQNQNDCPKSESTDPHKTSNKINESLLFSKILDDNVKEVDQKEEKSKSDSESNIKTPVKNESANIDTESEKRKKGRPKKSLSLSLTPSSPQKTPISRLSLPVDLNNLKNNDNGSSESRDISENKNVCPICSKNFRSSTVLIKHAKHCNGAITLDYVKSPKKRKNVEPIIAEKESDEIKNAKSTAISDEINDQMVLDQSKDDASTICNVVDKSKPISDEKIIEKKVEDSITDLKNDVKSNIIEKNNENITHLKTDICENDNKNDNDSKNDVECNVSENIVTENSSKDLSNTSLLLVEDSNCVESEKLTADTETKKTVPLKTAKDKVIKKSHVPPSPMTRLSKILRVKPPVEKKIECEVCGKTFRQLAHMVYHRKKHEAESTTASDKILNNVSEKSITKSKEEAPQNTEERAMLTCEICKKGFRKLHHLVEHREAHIHNSEIKTRRTSVASVRSEPEGGFRCDTCDKSFRKLHHLVQHREQHLSESIEPPVTPNIDMKPKIVTPEDNEASTTCTGCGKSFRKRHHMVEHRDIHCSPNKLRKENDGGTGENNVRLSITSSTSEDSNSCGICGKSYRKLHHMVEHRESHNDAKAIDNKISVPDKLSAKDIIHECSRCYMVFPNINALNKHTSHCFNKKVLKKLTVGENIENKPNPITAKRKSSDSMQSNASNKSALNRSVNSLHTSTSSVKSKETSPKVPTKVITRIPSASKAKKSKLDDIDEEDSTIKYMFNTEFKNKLYSEGHLKSPISNKKSKPISEHKERRSTSGTAVSAKSTSSKNLDMSDDDDDDSVRYSFPKTPKSRASIKTIDLTTPIADDSKTKKTRSTITPGKSTSKIPTKLKNKKITQEMVGRRSLGKKKVLIARNIRTVTKEELRCCNNTFSSHLALANHKRSHKDSKSCKCDCGKKFESEFLLRRHADTEHTPPKSFKCQQCDMLFRTAVQYVKHKNSHIDKNKSNTSTSSKEGKVRKVLKIDDSTKTVGKKNTTVMNSTRKRSKDAHAGVPLTERMRKAIASFKKD